MLYRSAGLKSDRLLDWHDRPIEKGGSSKPLSVRHIMVILETVEEVTVDCCGSMILDTPIGR